MTEIGNYLNFAVEKVERLPGDVMYVKLNGFFDAAIGKAAVTAAEDFTYSLRAIKRITVVGETSGGGAHPIQPLRIGPNLVAIVPVARSINPVTKGNWEGTGVKPDVAIAADKALAKANALALRQVLPKVDDPRKRSMLEKKLAELETAL